MNSEPLIEKNGTFASPATAFASSVLPVPGDPTNSTPFGMLPPSRWYFSGFFRKSTISTSSFSASSMPATSAKVIRGTPSAAAYRFALLRPMLKTPPWFRWARLNIHISSPKNSRPGPKLKQQRQQPAATLVRRARVDDDALLFQERLQAGVRERGDAGVELGGGLLVLAGRRPGDRRPEDALDRVAAGRDLRDVPLLHLILEGGVRDRHPVAGVRRPRSAPRSS